MSIRENLAIILFGISAIGLILGIILNMRYRNPYVLRDATDKDKWRWARNVSFFHTILIAGLTTIYLLNIFEQSNIITMVFIIILIFGLTFVPIVFWTKWDMERINNRNINYSPEIKDPTRKQNTKRLNEIYTQTLTQDEMKDQIDIIHKFLKNKGVDDLILTLGFGASSEYMYKPSEIKLVDLVDNIEERVSQGKFRLGNDDLYIDDENKDLRFILCHESDVHFTSINISILEEVESIWKSMKFQVKKAHIIND